ncbi:TonB-dependent receptor [Thalassotalea loyana]|uniref:TonB-dependent receptor n=1 Tax=Thalassotalea loyana TaxID=280483 RepID=A0ABQ6HAC9_9GAMM|nr:TonB-dependent receptor [Thalassotalea loyana]GLX84562.1 TonB-dependent receptor [Thalassotalea loyana]
MFERKVLTAAILSALGVSMPALANDIKEIETIEVTATKRAQSIQEVPVAVSALSGDAMDNLGIDNFQDYVEFLPNVVFQGTGPGQNEVYIRGAATTQTGIAVSSVQALQPSVAIYLDEQPVSMQGRNLDIYATDIERVEVLPGPQGTLFGASSQAGTVRIISKKPNHDDVEAGFDINTGFTNGGDLSNAVEGYFNLPISDDLAFRVAAYSDHQGGWIDNVENKPGEGGYIGSAAHLDRIAPNWGKLADPANTPTESPSNSDIIEENFNSATYAGARFGLSYLINDEWSFLVQHTAQTLETEGVFAYDPSYDDEESTSRFVPEKNEDTFGLTTWTLEGRLAQLDIVYAGGYLDRQIDATVDYTGYTNGGVFATYYACTYAAAPEEQQCYDPSGYYKEETDVTRFTQELRFNTPVENQWRVTAGIYYDEQELGTVGQFQLGSAGKFPDGVWGADGVVVTGEGTNNGGEPFPKETSFVNDITHEINQIALFGQFEYDLTDTITASIGARWYEIEDIFTGATTSQNDGGVTKRIRALGGTDQDTLDYFGPEEGQAILDAINSGQLENSLLNSDGKLKVDDTIFRYSINWQADDNLMFFANYSEGFRPPVTARTGGQLASNQTPGSAFEGYRIPVYSLTDELTNYEVGMKGDFFDRVLRVNATAYSSEINDLQTSRFDPTNIAFFYFTDNVGTAEIKGLDADFVWQATDNLIISGAFSILDTEITKLNPTMTNLSAPVGSELPYSADFSGNIRARYFYELPNGWEGYVNGSISYTGDRLSGMFANAYVSEDTHKLVYGTGTGLKIEEEISSGQYQGVTYNDSNGNAFAGGRYVAEAYSIANLAFGFTNGEWKAELYMDNLFDERAQLYIDEQQFTPKVVTNRPRTIGVRFSYDL